MLLISTSRPRIAIVFFRDKFENVTLRDNSLAAASPFESGYSVDNQLSYPVDSIVESFTQKTLVQHGTGG